MRKKCVAILFSNNSARASPKLKTKGSQVQYISHILLLQNYLIVVPLWNNGTVDDDEHNATTARTREVDVATSLSNKGHWSLSNSCNLLPRGGAMNNRDNVEKGCWCADPT